MTEEAKKIINCVYEARGRYGKTIIIDTVSGAKTARLEEVGAVHYKSYGVLASSNKKLLRRLIDQLVLEGYLKLGDYQVVKLGDISNLKSPDAKVLVRITDEDKLPTKAARAKERAARTEKSKNKSSRTKTSKEKSVNRKESLTPDELKLFEKLRELRLQIAREEGMPPYIVFSDRTLIDMAVKAPVKKDEMMEVSGVGENKYAKYGERFIASIEEWAKTAG